MEMKVIKKSTIVRSYNRKLTEKQFWVLTVFFTILVDQFEAFFEKHPFGQEKHDVIESLLTNNETVKNNDNFDPFGLSVTDLKKSKNLSSDDFGFDGDFANFDAFNNNDEETPSKSNRSVAWGESAKNGSNKIKEDKASKISKYNSDYSENYETDLNEILKRSMIDQ